MTLLNEPKVKDMLLDKDLNSLTVEFYRPYTDIEDNDTYSIEILLTDKVKEYFKELQLLGLEKDFIESILKQSYDMDNDLIETTEYNLMIGFKEEKEENILREFNDTYIYVNDSNYIDKREAIIGIINSDRLLSIDFIKLYFDEVSYVEIFDDFCKDFLEQHKIYKQELKDDTLADEIIKKENLKGEEVKINKGSIKLEFEN